MKAMAQYGRNDHGRNDESNNTPRPEIKRVHFRKSSPDISDDSARLFDHYRCGGHNCAIRTNRLRNSSAESEFDAHNLKGISAMRTTINLVLSYAGHNTPYELRSQAPRKRNQRFDRFSLPICREGT
jgi:hypothetical protein